MRFAAAACAAIAMSAAAQADTVYVTADRMVQNPAVIIEDGRIASVGRQGTLAAPADAERIDLDGLTLMPGLSNRQRPKTKIASQAISMAMKGGLCLNHSE